MFNRPKIKATFIRRGERYQLMKVTNAVTLPPCKGEISRVRVKEYVPESYVKARVNDSDYEITVA